VTTDAEPHPADSPSVPAPEEKATQPDKPVAAPATPPAAKAPLHPLRNWLLLSAGIVVSLAVGGYFLAPWVKNAMNTVSTDDAYVNGHVTFVAPRVGGQVIKVLVDDNQRVRKGDLLAQIDQEPYQVQLNIKKSAVVAAKTDLVGAEAQARVLVANLGGNVAALNGRKATVKMSRHNLKRGAALTPQGAMSKEELNLRSQTVEIGVASVEQALQTVYASRVGLGLPAQPAIGHELAEVPIHLDPDSSTEDMPSANSTDKVDQVGFAPTSSESDQITGAVALDKQDTQDDLNRIYERLVREAPAVKLAEAKVLQAQDDLALAELNFRYCDIVSEIDGQVTSRNVNPGNYVQTGQSLMAVRSVTEIWIDANFKETQLANLRIGQRVRCAVDMYGSRHDFKGRITGFTMGTGQTLALLPPQNATGNYVKIVQRLPVRIELTDYDSEKNTLFVGLSATPYVYFKEPSEGPHAGDVLQPYAYSPQETKTPKP
jgi:membrane fusion protein (multidrug efflux system)